MKKFIFIGLFFFTVLYAGNANSQGLQNEIKVYRPDYSGTWKLNLAKSKGPGSSDKLSEKDYKVLSENNFNVNRILIIEQRLPAVMITVKLQKGSTSDENFFGMKLTHYTDGRGDEYIEDFEPRKSTSAWQNNHLFVTHYSSAKEESNQIVATQEYALSADGKSLLETIRRTTFIVLENFKTQRKFDDSETLHLVYDRIK